MKRNISSYFFKKNISHYSWGNLLISFMLAVLITGTVAGSAFAAMNVSTAGSSSIAPSLQTPPPATPRPSPNYSWLGTQWKDDTIKYIDIAVPKVEVSMELSGSQQKLGISLFALQEDENGNTKQVSLKNVEAEITIVCKSLAKLENKKNKSDHVISVEGGISKYTINNKTGTLLLEDVAPGVYEVSVGAIDDYIMPASQEVTVRERISYDKVDVELEEDSADKGEEEPGGGAPATPQPTAKPTPSPTPKPTPPPITGGPEVGMISKDNGVGGETITFTQQAYKQKEISKWTDSAGNEYLYYADGTPSAYKITYLSDKKGEKYISNVEWAQEIVGTEDWNAISRKNADAIANANNTSWAKSLLSLNTYSFITAITEGNQTDNSESTEENSHPQTSSPTETPTQTPSETSVPSASPTPTATQTPEATAEPTPTAQVTETPAPTVTPMATTTPAQTATPTLTPSLTPTPTVVPTAVPTPTPPEQQKISFEDAGFKTAQAIFKLPKVSTIVIDEVLSGWQTIDGKRYYYHPNSYEKVTGRVEIDGVVYNFDSNGVMQPKTEVIGIDVSKWQPKIDWNAVKASGVEFVIIRVGYRGYESGKIVEDYMFHSHIKGAKAAGLRVGIYFFSQAINAEEGREEASACIEILQKYGLSVDYPIYFDTELSGAPGNVGRADNISNDARTDAVVAFCETVQNSGYKAGIYASQSWFYTKLHYSSISHYSLWNAKWGTSQDMDCDMWQYTATGSVNGISGGVDMNISYIG